MLRKFLGMTPWNKMWDYLVTKDLEASEILKNKFADCNRD